MRLIHLLVLFAVLGMALALPKESKKKYFKTRSDLPTNETLLVIVAPVSEGSSINVTSLEKGKEPEHEDKSKETLEESKEPDVKEPAGEETISDMSPEPSKDKEPTPEEPIKVEIVETNLVPLPKPTYLTKVKNLLKRFMEVLGLPWAREKRKSRKMKHDDIVDGLEFVEDMRAAYGAIRGRQECMRRAACSAGRYLRSVKGKELLIILLEKFAPQVLAEPISYLKESAIYRDPCDYACEADNL